LDALEKSLDAALDRLGWLAAENARLRAELADREERIALARARLKALADRLPQE
jgi:hypothetical protein